MAITIRVTPDRIRSNAAQCRDEAQALKEAIIQMSQIMDQLASEWTAGAGEMYAERFSELKPSLHKTEELLLEIANALDSSARVMEQTEAGIASMFRN